MKTLFLLTAVALSLPALTDWLVDRQISEPVYTKFQAKAMSDFNDKVEGGALFLIKNDEPITEFHRKQAVALAKIYGLTDEDVSKPMKLWSR